MRKLIFVGVCAATILLGQNTTPVILPDPGQLDLPAAKQYLSLTDAQLTQLRQITRTREDAERAIYEQMQQRQIQLDQLLQAGTNDVANVGRLMIEINNLRKQLPLPNDSYQQSAVAVLNDAQKAKLPPLVQALELQQAAYEATYLNLIPRKDNIGLPRPLPAANSGVALLPAPAVAERSF